MKVLVLSCATYADPATRKVWDRVAERGIEVTLALPRRIKHPFGPAIVPDTPWPTPGVRLVKLDTWYLHENGTHIVMKGVPRLIREVRPDVIHCVMEPWSITCLEALACITASSPRPKFGVQACETKPEQGGLIPRLIRTTLYRGVMSRCDYFIGWSQPVLRAATRLGLNGQPAGMAAAVGVDTDLFRPAVQGEKQRIRHELGLYGGDDFLVGFVGRFVEEKGVTDLVAAAEHALPSIPNMKLALLGTGPLHQQLAAAADGRPWMRLLKPRNQAGVATFMRALDLLAVPSQTTPSWEEQFGLVVAEAMASGVCVLGSTSGALPELIADLGWIVPDNCPSAIVDALSDACASRSRRTSKGNEARTRAMDCFSDHSVARVLTGVWSTFE